VGRVAEPGTVRVEQLAHVERYSHLMHLVSHVDGQLREDLDAFDAFDALFPAGTLTGAPKVRAMELIDEFESVYRGPYGGAVGYFSLSGNADFAITIRTLSLRRGIATVQAGGGIHTIERARQVLDAGAQRVIIGSELFTGEGQVNTMFAVQLAEAIGAERVVAGIDTKQGKIAVKGWKAQVELTPDDAIPQLEPHVAAFLYTHVDGEGLLGGFPIEVAARLRKLTHRQLIVAGGIRTQQEVDALDALGADAVVGMAVYTNLLAV